MLGSPKFGWLNKLKASPRTCKWKRSWKMKSRLSPASTLMKPGARRMLRPEFPKHGQVAAANAVVSNQCEGSRWSDGSAPSRIRFGRAVVFVPLGSVLRVTVNGCPVCAEKIPESCQFRAQADNTPLDLPNGN